MMTWIGCTVLLLVIKLTLSTDECGERSVVAREYVHHGIPSNLGEWPWHVAVFHQQNRAAPAYACGGTLVSNAYVVTAAHCTYPRSKVRPLKITELFVRAGIACLVKLEPSLQQIAVRDIIRHEEFNTGTLENDIALLKLVGEIAQTDYVKPICFWARGDAEELVVGKNGYIAGWGRDEKNELSDVLKSAVMPIVSRKACKDSDPNYYTRYLYDRKTLCAGFRNGTSAAPGDSGGGLFLEIAGKWVLRGIISNGKVDHGTIIDTKNYVVFTDVAYYRTWIDLKLDGKDAADILESPGENFSVCGKKTDPKSLRRGYREERPWPWKGEVFKVGDSGDALCEAAIVDENFLIAPADAFSDAVVENPSQLEVVFFALENGRNSKFHNHRVGRIIRHEQFDPKTRWNNIALIELKVPLRFTERLRPICLQFEEPTGLFTNFFTGNHGDLGLAVVNGDRPCDQKLNTSAKFFCHEISAQFRGVVPDLLYLSHKGLWYLRGITFNVTQFTSYWPESDKILKAGYYIVTLNMTQYTNWIEENAVVSSKNIFGLKKCPGPHAWMSSVHYREQEKCLAALVSPTLAITIADCVNGIDLRDLYPKFRTYIFATAISIAYIVPALIIYFGEFDGSYINRLQDERFIYWYDEMYHLVYIPFHTNMGCYLGGIIMGLIYYKQRKNYHTGNRAWYLQLIWYLTVPIGFLCLMSNMIFYQYNFEKPSIWMAMFYPTVKHMWIFLGAIMIYGVIYEYSKVIKGFLNFSIFVPLGRLTYCAYVCHVFMLKNVFFGTREVGYFSKVSLLSKVITVLVFSYFMGLILALLLEFPATAIQKHLFAKKLENATIQPKVNPVIPANNGNASSPSA